MQQYITRMSRTPELILHLTLVLLETTFQSINIVVLAQPHLVAGQIDQVLVVRHQYDATLYQRDRPLQSMTFLE